MNPALDARVVGRCDKKALAETGRIVLSDPPFDVLVIQTDHAVFAIEATCNHAGVSLERGELSRNQTCIVCPMHGFLFDLSTGRLVEPAGCCADQRSFEVVDEGDAYRVIEHAPMMLIR